MLVRRLFFNRSFISFQKIKQGDRKTREHLFLEMGTMCNQEPHHFSQMPVSTLELTDSRIYDYYDILSLMAKSQKPNVLSPLTNFFLNYTIKRKIKFSSPTLLF